MKKEDNMKKGRKLMVGLLTQGLVIDFLYGRSRK